VSEPSPPIRSREAAPGAAAAAADDWRPGARLDTLRTRAALLAAARGFFAARGVLEVETPLVVNAAVSDVNIHSASVQLDAGEPRRFLQTSPEYAMKRLLASGSGDIVQICKVVRGAERSALHNPEFTLVEWYRLGFDMIRIAEEAAALVNALLVAAGRAARTLHCVSYREACLDACGVDPLTASRAELETAAQPLDVAAGTLSALSRDELLDLLVALRVGPRLGAEGGLCALTHYPASQAALAALDPTDPRVALRFELYAEGIELANGFQELTAASEQGARFAADDRERRRRGLDTLPHDRRLLAALAAGLPACAGVALGFDRLVMLATGAQRIDQVVSFTTDHA
jgi:lysyl-tRNA synthetase class 2